MYHLFDGLVACDFSLPGVPEAHKGQADIHIALGQGSVNDTRYDWLHSWRENDGELVLSCARHCDEGGSPRYLLCFLDLADFIIAGNCVTCHPQPDCRQDSLRQLLLDQVIPRLWAHKGHLVLHASAVRLPDNRVIAFLGESGWGKSTLAAPLQARGSTLVSDDSINLKATADGVQLILSYTGLCLNEDSITTLIKRSFLLDTRDSQCATQQLQEASAVMRTTPKACSLPYPRDYRQLPTLCDALMVGVTL